MNCGKENLLYFIVTDFSRIYNMDFYILIYEEHKIDFTEIQVENVQHKMVAI